MWYRLCERRFQNYENQDGVLEINTKYIDNISYDSYVSCVEINIINIHQDAFSNAFMKRVYSYIIETK